MAGGPNVGGPESPFSDAVGAESEGGGVMVERGGPAGGALALPESGCDVGAELPMGGAGLDDTERGTPLGGGGVAFLASLSFGSAFLFTHRLSSGS